MGRELRVAFRLYSIVGQRLLLRVCVFACICVSLRECMEIRALTSVVIQDGHKQVRDSECIRRNVGAPVHHLEKALPWIQLEPARSHTHRRLQDVSF